MDKLETKDAFAALHPGSCYLFFGFAVIFTVIFMHPVVLVLSFTSATVYAIYLGRTKAARFTCAFLLPVMIVAAALNPAFNHRGVTILFYLWTGNPVTAESLLYGVAAALMIGSVIQWFYCYNAVMSSDKILWLFGRIIPTLALIISMTLRLIPRYTAQAKRIASAQQGLGRDITSGNLFTRARNGMSILSIMATWALENAVDTADSMASRGYGVAQRTSYSNYRFKHRDFRVFVFFVLTAAICSVLVVFDVVGVSYFPHFLLQGILPAQIVLCLLWAALCIFPLVLDLVEEVAWRFLRSRV
jgi:energy-coupling factor transport system permease protein